MRANFATPITFADSEEYENFRDATQTLINACDANIDCAGCALHCFCENNLMENRSLKDVLKDFRLLVGEY